MGAYQKQSLRKQIKFENLSVELTKCQHLKQVKCPIYGILHQVNYEGIQLLIGATENNQIPDQLALHHLLYPNVLLVPPHTTLEGMKLLKSQRKKSILMTIDGVSELGCQVDIGLSYNRVAYSNFIKQWRVKGDIHNGLSNYQTLLKNSASRGVYFSPQLMKALSQDRLYPKINIKQSDVFIFGVLLLEIIFEESLQEEIYDYQSYEIRLAPILEKLLGVESMLGSQIYELIAKMLEFDPCHRISFGQIREQIKQISQNQCHMFQPQPRNITERNIQQLTPRQKQQNIVVLSPKKVIIGITEDSGRSPGVIRKNLPISERMVSRNCSPMVRTSEDGGIDDENGGEKGKKIITSRVTPNRGRIIKGNQNQRGRVQPFGLGKQSQRKNGDTQKSFSKLKMMRV